jgi:hypothetical protein
VTIQTFAIAAAIGIGTSPVLAALLSALTKLVQSAVSLVVSLVISESTFESMHESSIIGYLGAHYPWFNTGGDTFSGNWEFVKPVGERRLVWFRRLTENWRVFWYHNRPLLVVAATRSGPSDHGKPCRIYSVRGTVSVEKMLIEVEAFQRAYNAKREEMRTGRFRVTKHTGGGFGDKGEAKDDKTKSKLEGGAVFSHYGIGTFMKPIGWNAEDIGATAQGSSLEDLSLAPELLSCIREIRFWNRNKYWYEERGIPWRRGYAFYGKPGTGKTSLIRAIAEDLDMPVDIFDLSSMTNHSFMEAWGHARASGGGCPHAVVFEDFDAVFDARHPDGGRKNKVSTYGVSFDCILNAIDGIERENGLLLFVTTNHVEALDPAMGAPERKGPDAEEGDSTRPGRIDLVLEVKALDRPGRVKMARRILQDEAWAQQMADRHDGTTAAQFQEKCSKAALRTLWGEDRAA